MSSTNVNTVLIGGNAVADAEYTEISPNARVCEFSIAFNEVFWSRDGVKHSNPNYVDIAAWKSVADIAKKIKKSDVVIVEGKLSENRWQSKGGDPRKKLRVKARRIYIFPKDQDYNDRRDDFADSNVL